MIDLKDLPMGTDGLPEGWPDHHGIASVGEQVCTWAEVTLVHPETGEPWRFTHSQARLLAWFYAVDDAGRYLWAHGMACLPKGTGKSPLAAAIACAEFAGPVEFVRFGPDGEPVMRPRDAAYVSLSALSYSQARDATFDLARAMLDNPAAHSTIDSLDVGQLKIRRKGGQLVPSTSGVDSKEGIRLTFALMDESQHWTEANHGVALAKKLRMNLLKRSGRSLETTNRWEVGVGSVAEDTARRASEVAEGRRLGHGTLIWAPVAEVKDLRDEDELRGALESLYSDAPWINIDDLIEAVRNGSSTASDTRRYLLNQLVTGDSAWIDPHWWTAASREGQSIPDGAFVALGFDGSRGRGAGMADATVLVAVDCRTGFVELLSVQQQAPGEREWAPNVRQVHDAVALAFSRFKVAAFFADPALWTGEVAEWEAKYGRRLKVNAGSGKIAWPTMRIAATSEAFEALYEAVVAGEMTHDGSPTMVQHGLNAVRVQKGGHVLITKEFQKSTRKIDALYATMLAWAAKTELKRNRLPYGFVDGVQAKGGKIVVWDD